MKTPVCLISIMNIEEKSLITIYFIQSLQLKKRRRVKLI